MQITFDCSTSLYSRARSPPHDLVSRLPVLFGDSASPTRPFTGLKDQTIHIRLAGVDAPEVGKVPTARSQAAHGYSPSWHTSASPPSHLQPRRWTGELLKRLFHAPSKAHLFYLLWSIGRLTKTVHGRTVQVEVLRKDRYGRIVESLRALGTRTR